MSKRSFITNITPLPSTITRDVAIAQLHDHHAMIELNPLVLRFEATDPPPNAPDDEAEHATWYEITDRINYLPGGVAKGQVSYKACFYNLPMGLQTHVFAPAGVDIRSKWSVGGTEPGQPKETPELGLDVPRNGLYIKEEVDLRCSIFMSNFVKRNLKKSHLVVADKIVARAALMRRASRASGAGRELSSSRSMENIVNWQASVITQQTSFPLDNGHAQPGDEQDSAHCTCTGITHQQTCPFFHPGDLAHQHSFPTNEHRRSVPLFAALTPSNQFYSQAAPQNLRPSELYGSASKDSCLCTGGLHEHGCPLDPGLRSTPSASPPTTSQPSQSSSSRPTETIGQRILAQRALEQTSRFPRRAVDA